MSGPVLTSNGLRTQATTAAVLQDVQWTGASGSADAIEAVYPVLNTAFYDGLILGVRALYENLTATPTFMPDSLPAYTIVKGAGVPLEPGDIIGAGYEMLLRFNLTHTEWELLNPYVAKRHPEFATSTGTSDALVAAFDPPFVAIADGQQVLIRANNTNATADPTVAIDGLAALTVYKDGQLALSAGDIPITHDAIFSYHDDVTPWLELLNPASGSVAGSFAIAGGTVNVITAAFSPVHTALVDGTRFNVRCSGINTVTEVTFNPDGLGPLNVYKKDKQALNVFDLGSLYDATFVYHDDTIDWFELTNPIGGVQTSSLTTDDTSASNVNTAQAWFPVAQDTVKLGNGSEFEIEGTLWLSRAAGTTSHTLALLFGGTAAFDYFRYTATCLQTDDLSQAAAYTTESAVLTAVVVKGASTSATEQAMVHIKGRCKVSAAGAGTLIPEFIYSAAPGGAPTRKAGTCFTVRPVPSEGTWG